ncbi:MAG: hypothetical protein KAI79_08000 [Bacteroidales bacterium]|nr:hypothetical protein [Bacteroidales bacterium]
MRRLFLLLSLLPIFLSTYSQSFFGVKGSFDLTANFLESTSNQLFYPSISGGLVYKYAQRPSWWFLQLELNYLHKEMEYTYTEYESLGNGYFVENIQSENIHFNFLSHIQLGKGAFKAGVHAGPFVSYMFDAGFVLSGPGSELVNMIPPPMISNYDYGMTVGTSFVYSLGASELQLDANFSTSYSSLTTSLDEQAFDYRNNQFVQLSLAYFFAPRKLKQKEEGKVDIQNTEL